MEHKGKLIGYEAGDICNRRGCTGVIVRQSKRCVCGWNIERCSCNEGRERAICPICGWDEWGDGL